MDRTARERDHLYGRTQQNAIVDLRRQSTATMIRVRRPGVTLKLSDPNERLAVGPVDPWQFSAAKSANYRLMRRRAAYRAGKSLLHFYQGLPAHVADVMYT